MMKRGHSPCDATRTLHRRRKPSGSNYDLRRMPGRPSTRLRHRANQHGRHRALGALPVSDRLLVAQRPAWPSALRSEMAIYSPEATRSSRREESVFASKGPAVSTRPRGLAGGLSRYAGECWVAAAAVVGASIARETLHRGGVLGDSIGSRVHPPLSVKWPGKNGRDIGLPEIGHAVIVMTDWYTSRRSAAYSGDPSRTRSSLPATRHMAQDEVTTSYSPEATR
jgi:hypothetical protein